MSNKMERTGGFRHDLISGKRISNAGRKGISKREWAWALLRNSLEYTADLVAVY